MIAIIKYNAGNTKSVQNALNKLGTESIITDQAEVILSAEKVIFPGVGEASSAMKYLYENKLAELIKTLTQPFLGICLGQQLMCKKIAEGNCEGLGIFDIDVKKFPAKDIVPHMGWNNLQNRKGKLFKDISCDENFYFVHSFYCEKSNYTTAECDYILPFSAGLEKDNFFATQFHPEKSGDSGIRVLKNFLNI